MRPRNRKWCLQEKVQPRTREREECQIKSQIRTITLHVSYCHIPLSSNLTELLTKTDNNLRHDLSILLFLHENLHNINEKGSFEVKYYTTL
jgi:hypothetical protein